MDRKLLLSQYERPYFYTHPPPPPPPPPPATADSDSSPGGFDLNSKVSPSVLLIIIILAIIFFISGLLHLLVRYLIRPTTRDPDEFDNVTALQGQLQQLFHLHDSGVDQSFIDTLPVFTYKSIIGVKNPFDCAVCLCEFEGEDKLRLLPKCSHAFHMECIDTWLLSHSTCPLCRNSLLSDFSPNSCCSPIVLVLESGSSESSREIVSEPTNNSIQRANSHLSIAHQDEEFGFSQMDLGSKPGENEGKEEENQEKVVRIKLGKFKNVDGVGEGSSEKNTIDGRRCFSMGSFEYVMDEGSSLQVPIRSQVKKEASKKSSLPITPGHRPARSECGGDSRRDFNGLESFKNTHMSGNAIGRINKESFSVSKIWLRGKKEKPNSTAAAAIEPSSRGSFSFRFPLNRNVAEDELKPKNGGGGGNRRAISEVDIGRWDENGGESTELGFGDEENNSCYSLDSQTTASNPPSFARRTLLWFLGRQQNKVVHSSFSTNL